MMVGEEVIAIWDDGIDGAELYEVQKLVRCKECKHWHSKDNLTYCDRTDYGYGYKADDYCSYGERKESE